MGTREVREVGKKSGGKKRKGKQSREVRGVERRKG